MKWRLRLDPATAQAFSRLPPAAKTRLRAALRDLESDPTGRSAGLDVRPLSTKSSEDVRRLRLGDWRVAFVVRGRNLLVMHVFHRRDGYAWLERWGRGLRPPDHER